jgi:hypothetical protein
MKKLGAFSYLLRGCTAKTMSKCRATNDETARMKGSEEDLLAVDSALETRERRACAE